MLLHAGALATRCISRRNPIPIHSVSVAPQVLLKAAQLSNVYNYGVKHQTPLVREHHKGPVLPTWGECDLDFFMARLKTAAETPVPNGLGMKKLEFVVKTSDEVLSMRHSTAKLLYMNHGLAVPDELEHVEVTNQPPPSSSNSSNSSTPQREYSTANRSSPGHGYTQADGGEALSILRGVKRSLEAVGKWVPEEAAPNACPTQ